jgi:hypothetical protein
MSIMAPIKTISDGLIFYYDTGNTKSYIGEPTTNIWSIQAGVSINDYNGWGMPNAGTAVITSTVVTNYGSWNGNRIWLVSVGSGTLVSYGSWRLCVDQPTAGSAYSSTRKLAAKIRMLTGSITNIGLHSGGGTGGYNGLDFTSILEKNVPLDCAIKDGWTQMLSGADWSSTTVGHCVGIGLNNSGPYSFLVTEPMYYPSNRLVNFTPTSRSVTQGLLDLVGNNTIDLTNTKFDVNSSVDFPISASDNSYITTNTNCNLTGDQTLTAWVKPTYGTASPHRTVICTDKNYQYGIKLMNYKNTARWGLWLGWGSSNYEAFTSSNINDNTWKMITGTWKQSTGIVKLYLNGQYVTQFSTGNTSAISLSTGYIWVGMGYELEFGNGQSYEGKIDSAAIYSRVLTDSEILQNYNSAKSRFGL